MSECESALPLDFEKTIETDKSLLLSRRVEGLSLWPGRVGSAAGYHTYPRDCPQPASQSYVGTALAADVHGDAAQHDVDDGHDDDCFRNRRR